MVVWKRCLRVLCFFREDCQKKPNTKGPKKTLIQTETGWHHEKKDSIFGHFNKRRIRTVFPLQWFIQWKDATIFTIKLPYFLFFFLIIIIMTRLYFLFLFAFVKRLRMCLNICIYDKYLYLCIVAHKVKLIAYMIVLFLWPHHTLYMVVL